MPQRFHRNYWFTFPPPHVGIIILTCFCCVLVFCLKKTPQPINPHQANPKTHTHPPKTTPHTCGDSESCLSLVSLDTEDCDQRLYHCSSGVAVPFLVALYSLWGPIFDENFTVLRKEINFLNWMASLESVIWLVRWISYVTSSTCTHVVTGSPSLTAEHPGRNCLVTASFPKWIYY